tara:strand:+ start:888 stop:1103 length:216 start_codon:yes stop_codon:yes gene_type:complete
LKHKLSDYTSGDLDAAARSPHISDAAKKEINKRRRKSRRIIREMKLVQPLETWEILLAGRKFTDVKFKERK